MKVTVIVPDQSTSAIVNVVAPLRYLSKQGHIELAVLAEEDIKPNQLANSDIIVCCRNSDPLFKGIYQLAEQLGIPMIYDLDDNLLDVPKENPSSTYYHRPSIRNHMTWLIQHANLVRIHSPKLKEIIEPYNSRTEVVWAAIDWTLIPDELPPLHLNPLKIVYAATPASGITMFPQIRDELSRILNDYASRVHLYFLGYTPRKFGHFANITFESFDDDFETFYRKFTRSGYAIGLAPMLTDTFYQCKTDIKYRDYAAAGAVGIYRDCPLYSRVKHLETGILVSGEPGSWYDALAMLIENPALLEGLRHNARQDILDRHNMDTVAHIWLNDLQSMPPRPAISQDLHLPKRFLSVQHLVFKKAQKTYRDTVPTYIRLKLRDWRLQLLDRSRSQRSNPAEHG